MTTTASNLYGRYETLLFAVVALSAFWGPLQIEERSQMEVGLNGTTAIKLVVSMMAAALGLWGFLRDPRVRDLATSWTALTLFGILGLALFSSLRAESSSSLPITVINIGYLMFIATCLEHLGWKRFISAVLAGILFFSFGAWFLYLFVPELGVFNESLPGGTIVPRLGGMSHPNMVSRSFVIGILVAVYLCRSQRITWRRGWMMIIPLGIALYLAWSRTAIMAAALAMAMLWLDKIITRGGIVLATLFSIVLIASLIFVAARGSQQDVIDKMLVAVTKTGDTDEITSATGRSEIWSEAIELIKQRPLLGYGFNSAPSLLINHSQATHNAVLYVTLSTGIVGGMFVVVLLMHNVTTAINDPRLLVRALATFLVVSCIAEDTVLETFPGPCTMLWFAVCILPFQRNGTAKLAPGAGDTAQPVATL